MSSGFGSKLRIQVFGQSHSPEIGVVIDGLPCGMILDMDRIQKFIDRRKGGKNAYSTKRVEADVPEIVSGVVDGVTCGAPLCALFKNLYFINIFVVAAYKELCEGLTNLELMLVAKTHCNRDNIS